METTKKKWNKQKVLKTISNYLLITLGCFLLAFGDVAFLVPLNLVTGGVASVGVIVQWLIAQSGSTLQIVDIVTWALQVILLIVSFIFLGKKFTLHTLFASIVYPLFFTLLYRFHLCDFVSKQLVSVPGEPDALAKTLLAGIFAGAFVGGGVAVTYFGDGSTGGFDVISVIIARHSSIKEALSAFFIDGSLIVIGMFCMKDIPVGLIGILSALVCALMVQYCYVNANSYIIADIVSKNYEEIMDYVHKHMEHATTVIDATGGYTGSDRKILRVAFNKRELYDFRNFIGQADPEAFVTFTQASMINGEGFDPLVRKARVIESQKENNKGEDGK